MGLSSFEDRPRAFGDRLQRWHEDHEVPDTVLDHGFEQALALWRGVFSGEAPKPTTRAERIVLAWRLVRQLGRCVGLLHGEEELVAAWGHLEPSPWTEPLDRCARPAILPGLEVRGAWAREARDLLIAPPAASILPPPVPERFTLTPAQRLMYDPARVDLDPALHRWCSAAERVAGRFRIAETPAGRAALGAVLDPARVRDVFPGQEEVEDFEEVLLDAALEVVMREGDRGLVAWLRRRYALTDDECWAVVAMLDERAVREGQRTTEQWRSRILTYFEDIRQKAAEACDIRTQRWVVRDMASVSGVFRAEPDDLMRDMERSTDALDAEDAQGAPGPRRIPSTRPDPEAEDGVPSEGDGTDG